MNVPVGYWTLDRCKRASLKYPNRTSFRKHCPGAYKASKKNGWLDEFYPNTRLDADAVEYWTYERCRDEAEKYGLRSDFQRYSYAAYQISYRNGWIEEFMPDKRKKGRRFHHPIIEQLNEHLEDHPLPACEIAEKAGVSINTISRWRHGVKPDLDLLTCVLEAMELKIVVVPIETCGTLEDDKGPDHLSPRRATQDDSLEDSAKTTETGYWSSVLDEV